MFSRVMACVQYLMGSRPCLAVFPAFVCGVLVVSDGMCMCAWIVYMK